MKVLLEPLSCRLSQQLPVNMAAWCKYSGGQLAPQSDASLDQGLRLEMERSGNSSHSGVQGEGWHVASMNESVYAGQHQALFI